MLGHIQVHIRAQSQAQSQAQNHRDSRLAQSKGQKAKDEGP
jgi:hypothetical protein